MKKPQYLLTHQSEANPISFVSLCGKIDSIAHLKHVAKDLYDKQREKAKQVSGDPLIIHMLTTCRMRLLHVLRVSSSVPL